MGEPTKCPDCGSEIPADAPGGTCPRCALGAALQSSPPVPTADEVAAKLPGYDILGVLGRGGMGVVFKARQKALDRIVALKVLPPAMAAAPGFAERFVREAKAMARLAHPNIVAVHEFGESGGLFYLVLEYVDGANVREAMRTGALGAKDALTIVPQICDALQYAHDRGVVHRDIKPENVLVTRDGRVKIADFGLAKLADREAGDVSLTGASQVMGTLHYMAPEQWERPKEVDHRADIYSLGVVFYEMLTGELPVGRFEPPSKKAQIDVRVDEVVMRSIERDRERRWQRADEMKTQVSALSSPTVAAPPPAGEASSEAATAAGIAAIVFVFVAVIATFVALITRASWAWWLVPGALVASIACCATWAVKRAKRPGWPWQDDEDKKERQKEKEGPDLPMSAYMTTRAIALVTLAAIAALAVLCGGFEQGPGGIAFQGAAFFGGIALWTMCDGRKDAVVAAGKGEGPAPGPPVSIEIVSVVLIALGLACIGWKFLGRSGDDEEDERPRKAATAAKSADPWDFAMETAPGEDPKHKATGTDRQNIWKMWSRAQALRGGGLAAALELYDADDRKLIESLDATRKDAAAKDGSLGTPLLCVRPDGTDLSKFRIERVRFGVWTGAKFENAAVEATDGERTLRFTMQRAYYVPGGADLGWFFAARQVEWEE
jgi:hypothetical protein